MIVEEHSCLIVTPSMNQSRDMTLTFNIHIRIQYNDHFLEKETCYSTF